MCEYVIISYAFLVIRSLFPLGMLAAEAAFKTLAEGANMDIYLENLRKSWVWDELYKVRNYRPVSDSSTFNLI